MTDPMIVLSVWRKKAAERKQQMLEGLARGLNDREYMHGCGRVKELEYQMQFMQDLITGNTKEVENAED